MSESWRDSIVGARMTVDQEFADRVESSSFSRQQWGLVMTAVEFEIEDPADPEAARMVANTDHLPSILPELDSIEQQMQAMGGGGGGRTGGRDSGIVSRIAAALGLGGSDAGVSAERREEAESLAREYANRLQDHLESTGRWEEVRRTAAETH